jgi:hypothetical protein
MTLDGGILATSAFNSGVRDPLDFLLAPPIGQFRQTAAQTLTTGTWTAVTFDAEDVDSAGGHSTSSNTSRYTAVYTGWYRVSGGVGFTGNSTGRRGGRWAANGSLVSGSAIMLAATSTGSVAVPAKTMLVYLAVGDYVELQAYQESGGNLDTNVGSGDLYSLMAVEWRSN